METNGQLTDTILKQYEEASEDIKVVLDVARSWTEKDVFIEQEKRPVYEALAKLQVSLNTCLDVVEDHCFRVKLLNEMLNVAEVKQLLDTH